RHATWMTWSPRFPNASLPVGRALSTQRIPRAHRLVQPSPRRRPVHYSSVAWTRRSRSRAAGLVDLAARDLGAWKVGLPVLRLVHGADRRDRGAPRPSCRPVALVVSLPSIHATIGIPMCRSISKATFIPGRFLLPDASMSTYARVQPSNAAASPLRLLS